MPVEDRAEIAKAPETMYFNRRRKPRVVPEGFTFIQVERDDGGRILNVSEEGLCFEAFSTISISNSVRFWFSFDLRERIEAVGRLVWMDAAKGIGGLRFTELSEAARQKIRSHVAGKSPELVVNEKMASPVVPASRDSLALASEPAFAKLPEPIRIPPGWTVPAEPVRRGGNVLALQESPESAVMTQLVPLQRHLSATRSRFFGGLFLGMLLTFLVMFPILKYANQPSQGSAAKTSGQPTQGELGAQGSVCPPTVVPAAPSPTLVKSQPSKSPSHPSGDPLQPSIERHRTESTVPGGSQKAPLAAPTSNNNSTLPARTSSTPDQLWAAVQAGNASAALTLANLYLTGDGVPVNCAQAKVLLQVASQKNNAQAIRKLHDLETTGCPAP